MNILRMMSVGLDIFGSDCHSENRRTLQSAFLPPTSVVETKLGGADPDPLFPHLYYHWFETFPSLLGLRAPPSRLVFGYRSIWMSHDTQPLGCCNSCLFMLFSEEGCIWARCEQSIMRAVESLSGEHSLESPDDPSFQLVDVIRMDPRDQGSWRVISFIATHLT